MSARMNLTLKVWRQAGPDDQGRFETYEVDGHQRRTCRSSRCSTSLNEQLIARGRGADRLRLTTAARASAARAALMINGEAHGPQRGTADLPAAHAHVQGRRRRSPSSRGAPRRSRSSRTSSSTAAPSTGSSQAGGYISVNDRRRARRATRSRCPKDDADRAMDAAACIGCGACVAACPNASAIAVHRRQGHPPRPAAAGPARARRPRASTWSRQHDAEGFGGCTNIGECAAACPKGISMDIISRLNRDLLGALRAGVRPKS